MSNGNDINKESDNQNNLAHP